MKAKTLGWRRRFGAKELWMLFCIMDVLILPYFRLLHCSFSMIFVCVWYILNPHELKVQHIAAGILVLASNLCGSILYNIDMSGLTDGAIFIYVFLLYGFLKSDGENLHRFGKKLLQVYVLIILLLSMIYIVAPNTYYLLRSRFTMSGDIIEFTERELNRFTLFFSDPNNAGGAFATLLAYMLTNYRDIKIIKLLLLLVSLTMAILLTASISATVELACVLLVFAILKPCNREQRINRRVIRATMFIVILLVVFAWNTLLSKNEYVQLLMLRTSRYEGISVSGGRLEIWSKLIKSNNPLKYIIVGVGKVLDGNGKTYLVHNGILHLIYCYGVLSVALYFRTFVKIERERLVYAIPYVPIVITITMNTGFGDYRFMSFITLIMALIACPPVSSQGARLYSHWQEQNDYTRNECRLH